MKIGHDIMENIGRNTNLFTEPLSQTLEESLLTERYESRHIDTANIKKIKFITTLATLIK